MPQALTILLSIWIFQTSTGLEMDAGISLSIMGYAVYTCQKTAIAMVAMTHKRAPEK